METSGLPTQVCESCCFDAVGRLEVKISYNCLLAAGTSVACGFSIRVACRYTSSDSTSSCSDSFTPTHGEKSPEVARALVCFT